jgi:hypothetical protein
MPFVASSEIAKVGYEAILHGSRHFKRRDPLIIGPQLLSYTEVNRGHEMALRAWLKDSCLQVAAILTKVLGRKITHNIVSEGEMREFYKNLYQVTDPSEESDAFLDWSAELDRGLERGTEEGLDAVEGVVIGKIDVATWVRERKAEFGRPVA